jgi:hypothetical protein
MLYAASINALGSPYRNSYPSHFLDTHSSLIMAPNTSQHLGQSVFGTSKLNVAELYNIKGQVALGESTYIF